MQENGKATAAYVRVSSDKQDTARQETRIRATGLPISRWFRDNIGRNPRDLPHKRPAFQEMLQAVEGGLLGKIVVDRQDRFGVANAFQWGSKFIDLIRGHGATLVDADGKVLSADDDVSILTGTLGAITSTREQKAKRPTGTLPARFPRRGRASIKAAIRPMTSTWFALALTTRRSSEPPRDIDGYQRDPTNAWRFLPLWPVCPMRLATGVRLLNYGCVGVIMRCNHPQASTFSQQVSYPQCETCRSRKA